MTGKGMRVEVLCKRRSGKSDHMQQNEGARLQLSTKALRAVEV